MSEEEEERALVLYRPVPKADKDPIVERFPAIDPRRGQSPTFIWYYEDPFSKDHKLICGACYLNDPRNCTCQNREENVPSSAVLTQRATQRYQEALDDMIAGRPALARLFAAMLSVNYPLAAFINDDAMELRQTQNSDEGFVSGNEDQ